MIIFSAIIINNTLAHKLIKVTTGAGNDKVFVCGYLTLQCYEVYTPK